MREIPLTQGYVALVDDEDYDRVSEFKWHALVTPRNVYARRWTRTKPRRLEYLHRMLVSPNAGELVDHIDGNPLNNTRENLRVASHAENSRNRRTQTRSRSGFKGVDQQGAKWRAAIQIGSSRVHIGLFETPEDAARAYDKAAVDLFGEFARLNYPEGESM